MMREDIKPCPNCGFFPALHKKKNKFYYECCGDCWTQTSKYYSPERALKAWNELSEKEVEPNE